MITSVVALGDLVEKIDPGDELDDGIGNGRVWTSPS
jgi:hypothetical protein